MRHKRSKHENVMELAWELMEKGAYVISQHAFLRQNERAFSVGDIRNVIATGYHEKKKDEYKEEFGDWNYAICGHTLDNENARVCIAFSENSYFVVITVIRLEVSK